MHQRAFLGGGWARGGGVAGSGVVRRAHPASGAQWNVQVVRGKVNGRCLWNACKALSLGLLLMVLGAAMATIGYYADDLSIAQEVRGNHTVRVKNESRGFHLNNLSYAGPIVMGVGGFIVVAACVMTFEARDSAAKVVPARFKMSTVGGAPTAGSASSAAAAPCGRASRASASGHGSLRTSGSQTATLQRQQQHQTAPPDRRAITQSFLQFSKGLAIEGRQARGGSLGLPQASINKSPSAPNLARSGSQERSSPTSIRHSQEKTSPKSSRQTFASAALLNPGLLHRQALSVDETAPTYRVSHESLHGSQGSMAMDLHLECPVTLRVRDQRRNPLRRQRRVDEDVVVDDASRRNSHSCSPRMAPHHMIPTPTGGSAQQLSQCAPRRSSNASDCSHRSRARRREQCPHVRGRLERAISSDSRLTGAAPRCRHHRHYPSAQTSGEGEPAATCSDTDIRSAQQGGAVRR